MTKFRVWLACSSLGFVTLAASIAACSGDDFGTPTDATGDAGGTDAIGDEGVIDSSPPRKDSGGGPTPAKIIVVHAATDYGPNNSSGIVRVCYATKTAVDPTFALSPLPPLPHSTDQDSTLPYPGIPIGAGGPFPSTGLPLEDIEIRPYVISAKALADRGVVGTSGTGSTARCSSLLKPGGFAPDGGFPDSGGLGTLQENKDYWQLGDIPAGTFKNGKTYLLAINGCTADTDGLMFAAKCGMDPVTPGAYYIPPNKPGRGNLTISVLEIDSTVAVANNEMGVQIVHLSPQYEFLRTASGDGGGGFAFKPIFGDPDGGDASYTAFSANDTELRYTQPPVITPVAKLKGIVTATAFFAANDKPFLPMILNNSGGVDSPNGKVTIQYLSEGKTVPSAAPLYVDGKAFTFVLIGDPQASDGLRKVHYLGFPNQFTPPSAN